MKKIILFLFTLSSLLLAENWNPIQTLINVSNAVDIDLHSNNKGNNVLVLNQDGSLYYRNLDFTGSEVRVCALETSGVTSSSITGDATKSYVVYSKNNSVYTSYTTNGGESWSPTSYLSNSATSVDAVFSNEYMHVVFLENNIAKYVNYNTYWSSPQTVSGSDFVENARFQKFEYGTNKEGYVMYSTGGNLRYRKINLIDGSFLGDITTIYYGANNFRGFGVDLNYLYLYYLTTLYDEESDSYFTVTTQRITNKSTLESSHFNYFGELGNISTTNTSDNKVHTIFDFNIIVQGLNDPPLGIDHACFNNGSYTVESTNNQTLSGVKFGISSTKDDLYSVWKGKYDNYLYFAYLNVAPVAPTNLVLYNTEGRPELSWTACNEADFSRYNVYRNIAGWVQLTNAQNPLTNSGYLDYTILINNGQEAGTYVYYKVTAVDLHNAESNYSNVVFCEISDKEIEKINANSSEIKEYALCQNYPNPFNPSTTISYEIPVPGVVQIKVYDILGKEVAQLVNEYKSEGRYSVNFTASNLPSGLYLYSIKVNDYSNIQKMSLIK